jgi:hypothetical protein
MEHPQKEIRLSIEKIIDLIREERNDLIQALLDDNNLKNHYSQRYEKELSKIKIEFLKKDLKELQLSPLDLIHYASLITGLKESNTTSIAPGGYEIFYLEINVIFKKYDY